MIPIFFRYTYKNYPFSPRATTKSKQLGICTCTAMCLVYGLFWVMIVFAILTGIGIGDDASMVLSLLSLIGMVVLIRRIKQNSAAKIEQLAMTELLALQNTNPAAFAQYAAAFAAELARYQTPYSYQAPPQYQTSAASAPVQQGFDIQPESVPEEPVVVETPQQPETNHPQPAAIELPPVQPEEPEPAPAQPEPVLEEPSIPVIEPTVPEKLFCGQCGSKLKSGSLFCHNCGSKL